MSTPKVSIVFRSSVKCWLLLCASCQTPSVNLACQILKMSIKYWWWISNVCGKRSLCSCHWSDQREKRQHPGIFPSCLEAASADSTFPPSYHLPPRRLKGEEAAASHPSIVTGTRSHWWPLSPQLPTAIQKEVTNGCQETHQGVPWCLWTPHFIVVKSSGL